MSNKHLLMCLQQKIKFSIESLMLSLQLSWIWRMELNCCSGRIRTRLKLAAKMFLFFFHPTDIGVNMLETVIPRGDRATVMILHGEYKSEVSSGFLFVLQDVPFIVQRFKVVVRRR